ncbi:MAG: PAN domain-containing protein [Caulobacteraceae bacterium]
MRNIALFAVAVLALAGASCADPAKQAEAPAPADVQEVAPLPAPAVGVLIENADLPGNTISYSHPADMTVDNCRTLCQANEQCMGFTLVRAGIQNSNAICYLKSDASTAVRYDGADSERVR